MRGLLSEPLEVLVSGLVEKLIYHAGNGNVRVEGIAATAWTQEGQKLCEILGMTELGSDRFGHPVYYVQLDDSLANARTKLTSGMGKLLSIYQRLDREHYFEATEVAAPGAHLL